MDRERKPGANGSAFSRFVICSTLKPNRNKSKSGTPAPKKDAAGQTKPPETPELSAGKKWVFGLVALYLRTGSALSKMNHRAEAIQQFRQAIQLRPDYWEAVYALGEELAFDVRQGASHFWTIVLVIDPLRRRCGGVRDAQKFDEARGKGITSVVAVKPLTKQKEHTGPKHRSMIEIPVVMPRKFPVARSNHSCSAQ